MSPKILSNRLKLLSEKGLISKNIVSDSPVQIRYTLTESGEKIAALIKGLGEI